MAKKRKDAEPAASDDTTMKVIPAAKFKTLVRRLKSAESDKNEAVSAIGGVISAAVEKDHLDKRAFRLFRQLDRLEDNKLATTLAHFDYYRDIGGLDERAKAQGEMFKRPEAGDDESGEASEQQPDNVTPLRAAE